ncbi:MAG TPA: hypothetical protein VIY48_07365 [Candidatus Paceibacterota bacterium]
MSTFVKGGSVTTPFGRNEFLRSTRDVKTDSWTFAASSILARTIDGTSQKILQPGTVLAKITSGGESGKVGPYSSDTVGVTDGRSTTANIIGLCMTFLPWQLLERDVEVSCVYQCTAVQAWCLYYTLAGGATPVALDNTTADLMRGGKRMQINFV